MPYKSEYDKYKLKDPDYLLKDRLYKKKFRVENTAQTLLSYAKVRAKKRNLDFNLEITDISIPDVCPVFKTPFVYGTMQAASVDRIDPTKGYTKDNIQIISRRANQIKNSASAKELKEFANWVNQSIP